ncbi:MipA/OmpV family protein [Colwelliaceae bacterium 6471]
MFYSATTYADNTEYEVPIGEAEVGQWSFSLLAGYAAIENPLNKHDDIKTYLLPTWSYYGERFYIDNTTIGYSIIETDSLLFDFSGYLNEEGALFNLDNANLSFLDISNYVPRKDMRPNAPKPVFENIERNFSYMVGAAVQWPNEYIQARLVYGKDVTAGHGGEEFTFSLFNYYHLGNFKLNWQLGAVRKSQQLVEYYYQFRPEEINGFESPYKFKDITNKFVQVAASYQLSKNFDLVLSVKKTWLDEELLTTPLVAKDSYIKWIAGFNYKF